MKSIRSADLLARLMLEGLGYKQFAAAGGDIGSRVVRLMALAHPEWLIGIHLTDIGFPREVAFPPEVPNPSPVEQQFLGSVPGWVLQEGAYSVLQTTKPQKISFFTNNSPSRQTSSSVENSRALSDHERDYQNNDSKT